MHNPQFRPSSHLYSQNKDNRGHKSNNVPPGLYFTNCHKVDRIRSSPPLVQASKVRWSSWVLGQSHLVVELPVHSSQEKRSWCRFDRLIQRRGKFQCTCARMHRLESERREIPPNNNDVNRTVQCNRFHRLVEKEGLRQTLIVKFLPCTSIEIKL